MPSTPASSPLSPSPPLSPSSPPRHGPGRITLIAAVARQGAIGWQNGLLVSLPEDMRHFRRTTTGCPVIMGRRTWDSLPPAFRPLPARRNLVLSRTASALAGAEVHSELDSALAAVTHAEEVFIIGGAEIYALALPVATDLVLTEIDADYPADAYFPEWRHLGFREVERHKGEDENPALPPYDFVRYRRA